MAVPPEFIEDLRQRIPLSDVIGKRVKLIRKGRRFTGLCPFHSEKTPSFSVVDDDGFYHCFGCGVHGDAKHRCVHKQRQHFQCVQFKLWSKIFTSR